MIEMTPLRAAMTECKYWKRRLDEETDKKAKPSLLVAYRIAKARVDKLRREGKS